MSQYRSLESQDAKMYLEMTQQFFLVQYNKSYDFKINVLSDCERIRISRIKYFKLTFATFHLLSDRGGAVRLGQFHQHSTRSFYASSLKPILLAHGVERKNWAYFLAMYTSKVGHIFVGETEQPLLSLKNGYRCICACAIRLVKLTLMSLYVLYIFTQDRDIKGMV